MRTLVTGATGFIGQHLVRALLAGGHQVRILARDAAKAAHLPPEVELHLGDLSDCDQHLTRDIDIIFHLGAAVSGPWPRHRLITVEGTRRLARAAAASGIRRFVHVSSLAVYDKSRIAPDDQITEDSPLWSDLNAAGPYARGKIESEHIIREEAAAGGFEFAIARPGLVYGPGHVIFQHLGPRLGKSLFLPLGGGRVLLPLVHVDSVVDALLRLADAPEAAGRIFNIVDTQQVSKSQYLRALSRANCRTYRCIGIPASPLTAAARAAERLRRAHPSLMPVKITPEKVRARTTERRYSSAALERMTGWQPAHDLDRGLQVSFEPARQRTPVQIRRVGIIGAGRMADFHIRALRQIPGIEICGILDIDPRAAASVAGRHRIPLACTRAEEFYTRGRPDAVHILTPPHTHTPLALEAMKHSAHVLLEKPAAISLDECNALQQAALDTNLTIGINHGFVADSRIRRALALIQSAAIGDVVHIDITWAFDIRRFHHMLDTQAGTSWLANLPGGPLEDLAPHPLSIAFMLMGEQLRPVSHHNFRSGRLEYPFDDELRLLLAGRRATASLSMTLNACPDDMSIAIYGTQGTLRLDVQNMLMTRARPLPGPKAVTRGVRTISAGLSTIAQTVRSAAAVALGRADPPGAPRPLIHEHYAALASGQPLPVDLLQAQRIVEIVRTVWPLLTNSRIPDLSPGARSQLTNVS